MGFIDSLFRKKPLTVEQKRERYMLSKYQLTKDPDVPFRYWINDRKYIEFNIADPESVENAENAIVMMLKNPKIETATKDQQMTRGPRGRTAKPDEWRELQDLGANLNAVSDYFTQGVGMEPDYGLSGGTRRGKDRK